MVNYNLEKLIFIKRGAGKLSALKKWKSKQYLKDKFNNIEVYVEIYKSKKDMGISKSRTKQVNFNDYIDNLHENWYLPDCSLLSLDINKDLYEDLVDPMRKEIPKDYRLFLGKNTRSGAHIHVEDDFVINQIVGKKIVYCLDFKELNLNHISNKRNNFSEENFFDLDKNKYKIQKFELEPGDMLFIPPWIWHAVENVGESIAVTKVFEREKSYFEKKGFEKLKQRHAHWLLWMLDTN